MMSRKAISKITSVALSATTVVWLTGASALAPVAFAQTDDIAALQALIAQLTGQLSSLSGGAAPAVSVGVSSTACNFTRTLTVGSSGSDVKCLQQTLNGSGFQIAASGPGSPGNETSFFGSLTRAAVIKWQEASAGCVLTPIGLSKGTGVFGAQSRKCYSPAPVTPATPGVTPVVRSPIAPVGGLVVSLGANNPVSANIPKGAAEVPYVQLVVSGTGTLDALTFMRVGLGATGDFASGGLKLYEGVTRLTTGKSINSTTHEVDFPNLGLAVNGSRTLVLAADMSASATGGNINAFNLIKINGQKVAGINGSQMVVAGATVGTVTAAKSGSPGNPTVGEQNALLTEFKLTVNSTEDMQVRRIVLTNGGSISSANLNNLVLKQAGNTLATVAGHTGRDLFVLELAQPFTILKGQEKVFQVYGNIGPLSKKDETVKLYLDTTNDAYTVGNTYGYGATVTNNFDSTAANHHTLTLRGAEITLTFNGPVTGDLAARAQDVTLFDFTVASKNNVEVRKLIFTNTVANIGTGEGFNDWKIVDAATGAAVSSASDITATGDTTITDIINISAGSSRRFRVTADVDPDNDASDTIKVTLKQIGASDIKNLDNNTFVAQADIVPNAAVTGNTQTVRAVDLDITLSGVPASHNIVAGAATESLVGINLRAVEGDVKITSVKVTASATAGKGSDAQTINDLRTLGVYVNDQLISQKQNLATASSVNTATFTGLNHTITKGQTIRLVVKADQVATDATANNVYFISLADLSTDLTAVDTEGNTLSLSGSTNASNTVTLTVTAPTIRVDAVTDQDTEEGLTVGGKEQLLGKFDFFAANAPVIIKKLKVGVATDSNANSSTTLGEEIKEIRLYDGNSLIIAGIPANSGSDAGRVRFESSAGLFTVPGDTTKQVEIRALMGDVTGVTGGANTGSNIVAYISDGNFDAVSGSTALTTLTGAAAKGNIKRLYRTIPTVTVSNPSSSTLVAGEVEALKFTIAADPAGDVEWSKLEFTTSLSNATLTANTITLRYAGSDLTLSTKTIAAAAGEGVITLSTAERITAGQSKTYSLLLTVDKVAGSTTAASLTTQLKRNETKFATPNTFAILENTKSDGSSEDSFVWSDRGILPHSATAKDWHNGFRVKTLPSGTKALVK